jgi:hypothetical protein
MMEMLKKRKMGNLSPTETKNRKLYFPNNPDILTPGIA